MDTNAFKIKVLEISKKVQLKWLADNDYIINKVFLGEWSETDQRFIDYKEKRQLVRDKLDEIEAELAELNTH